MLTRVNKAEDEEALIVRMYESAGRQGKVSMKLPGHPTGVSSVSMMEDTPDADASVTMTDGKATFNIKPWQIVTLKVTY
jgi:alpha-mannosidase